MSLCRAVYDTNVIVSADLTNGVCNRLIYLALLRIVGLVVSEELLEEYREVLNRFKFHNTPEEVDTYIRLIKRISTRVATSRRIKKILDDPDNRILECAVAGEVDYIVTGNKKHFSFSRFEGIRIVSPAGFLKELQRIKVSR